MSKPLETLIPLNERENDGISVALLWDNATGETFIELETDSEWFRVSVPAENAADAFAHPFCYVPPSAISSVSGTSIYAQ